MTNQEKIEEILNKQFKKSIFSGYDTLDVDEFFDQVIEYLKTNDKRVKEAEDIAATLQDENVKLSKELADVKAQFAQSQILVNEFRSNGYENVVNNAHIQQERKNKEGK